MLDYLQAYLHIFIAYIVLYLQRYVPEKRSGEKVYLSNRMLQPVQKHEYKWLNGQYA
jgi:hypothetical protein